MFRAVMAFGLAILMAGNALADGEPIDGSENVTRVLLIGHAPDHPFGTHMYLPECRLLARCLEQTPGVEAIVSDRWPKDRKTFEGVDAVVVYSSPGGNLLLKGPAEKHAQRLLGEGVGLTAVHWGTGAIGDDLGQRYLDVLGGWFDLSFGGLDVGRYRLTKIASDHPICRGWQEYDLRDEIYLKTKLVPAAKPILKVNVKGTDQVVAWVFDRPDSKSGRSFGITLGHFHDNFEIEAFRRAIVNGILWTAHRDVPKTGAPVHATAADLDIGEPPEKK